MTNNPTTEKPRLLIVKIGGSLFSDKMTEKQLDHVVMARYADLVSQLYHHSPGNLVMISGGGSYGHDAVRKVVPDDPLSLLNLSKANTELKWIWHQLFRQRDIPSYPINLASATTCQDKRDFSMDNSLLNTLRENKFLPLLSGDSLLNDAAQLEIVGSDHIPSVFKKFTQLKVRIVILTNVPGVLKRCQNGQLRTIPVLDQHADYDDLIWKTPAGDTSDAMRGKVDALLSHATWAAECFIVKGEDWLEQPELLYSNTEQWPVDRAVTRVMWR
jgi:isopentenyl phosphate kinase